MTKGEDKELFITKLVSFSWKHVLETWAGNSVKHYKGPRNNFKYSSVLLVIKEKQIKSKNTHV